jgi:cation transport regulator
MQYKTNHELPTVIQNHLPAHAQDIYREAFNQACEEYDNPKNRHFKGETREEMGHKEAWDAVRQKYYEDDNHNWHPKKNDNTDLAHSSKSSSNPRYVNSHDSGLLRKRNSAGKLQR